MLLQLGDIGDNVKYLQYGLHILCCSPNGFDGEFGNGTLTAVKKFQSKYGLVSDGIVGDVTWNTLKNEIATMSTEEIINPTKALMEEENARPPSIRMPSNRIMRFLKFTFRLRSIFGSGSPFLKAEVVL